MPVAAITVSISRSGRMGLRSLAGWSRGSLGRRAVAVAAVTALAGAVAYAWWPNGDYEPIRPGERGTIGETLAAIPDFAGGRPSFTEERERRFDATPTVREQEAARSATEDGGDPTLTPAPRDARPAPAAPRSAPTSDPRTPADDGSQAEEPTVTPPTVTPGSTGPAAPTAAPSAPATATPEPAGTPSPTPTAANSPEPSATPAPDPPPGSVPAPSAAETPVPTATPLPADTPAAAMAEPTPTATP
jgi:hypothetical protein